MITATLALRLLVDLRDHGPLASQIQATENVYMDSRRDELDLYQHHHHREHQGNRYSCALGLVSTGASRVRFACK